MTDKKQILDNLMEHGKTTGKLTTKEITDALEKLTSSKWTASMIAVPQIILR